ncbi:hypothetical protein F2Q69_00049486 [Brassica cretica]|uniref:EamA domain-containing protein n=1 Tax=Brassica cretica TaxID=69181 RepID=A0A8S9PUD9_BRACR|nr:hypothetical protein F2Q69_00049486 [Brassica cretica]
MLQHHSHSWVICYWRLSNVYGSIMLYRRPVIKAKWYHYFLLALVNVEANFLVVKAFQYTSMTSVMLLDCWAIPCVLVLTWVFLKTRYSLMKISGVAVCIVGVVMVVFSDVHAGDRAGGSNPAKGDLLVIAAATLYAVINTSEEFFVKTADRIELMSFVGLFGSLWEVAPGSNLCVSGRENASDFVRSLWESRSGMWCTATSCSRSGKSLQAVLVQRSL